jgi:hypothetical protein
MTFTKGQRVHVEFDGVIAVNAKHSAYVDSGNETRWVDHKDMTPLDPENWPPQVGDIWEVDGKECYVRAHTCRASLVISSFDGTGDCWYDSDFDNFKSLSPTLVRRRGQ